LTEINLDANNISEKMLNQVSEATAANKKFIAQRQKETMTNFLEQMTIVAQCFLLMTPFQLKSAKAKRKNDNNLLPVEPKDF